MQHRQLIRQESLSSVTLPRTSAPRMLSALRVCGIRLEHLELVAGHLKILVSELVDAVTANHRRFQ
jgi:hypothetical protein